MERGRETKGRGEETIWLREQRATNGGEIKVAGLLRMKGTVEE